MALSNLVSIGHAELYILYVNSKVLPSSSESNKTNKTCSFCSVDLPFFHVSPGFGITCRLPEYACWPLTKRIAYQNGDMISGCFFSFDKQITSHKSSWYLVI